MSYATPRRTSNAETYPPLSAERFATSRIVKQTVVRLTASASSDNQAQLFCRLALPHTSTQVTVPLFNLASTAAVVQKVFLHPLDVSPPTTSARETANSIARILGCTSRSGLNIDAVPTVAADIEQGQVVLAVMPARKQVPMATDTIEYLLQITMKIQSEKTSPGSFQTSIPLPPCLRNQLHLYLDDKLQSSDGFDIQVIPALRALATSQTQSNIEQAEIQGTFPSTNQLQVRWIERGKKHPKTDVSLLLSLQRSLEKVEVDFDLTILLEEYDSQEMEITIDASHYWMLDGITTLQVAGDTVKRYDRKAVTLPNSKRDISSILETVAPFSSFNSSNASFNQSHESSEAIQLRLHLKSQTTHEITIHGTIPAKPSVTLYNIPLPNFLFARAAKGLLRTTFESNVPQARVLDLPNGYSWERVPKSGDAYILSALSSSPQSPILVALEANTPSQLTQEDDSYSSINPFSPVALNLASLAASTSMSPTTLTLMSASFVCSPKILLIVTTLYLGFPNSKSPLEVHLPFEQDTEVSNIRASLLGRESMLPLKLESTLADHHTTIRLTLPPSHNQHRIEVSYQIARPKGRLKVRLKMPECPEAIPQKLDLSFQPAQKYSISDLQGLPESYTCFGNSQKRNIIAHPTSPVPEISFHLASTEGRWFYAMLGVQLLVVVLAIGTGYLKRFESSLVQAVAEQKMVFPESVQQCPVVPVETISGTHTVTSTSWITHTLTRTQITYSTAVPVIEDDGLRQNWRYRRREDDMDLYQKPKLHVGMTILKEWWKETLLGRLVLALLFNR